MTPEQTIQWNKYSCMSEALIEAAKNKNPMTPDEYRAKYEKYFPYPNEHYGGLFLSSFHCIAKDIGFGPDMDLVWDYTKTKERFNTCSHLVFVFSALNLRQGHFDSINHTTLLLAIDDTKFSVNGFADMPASDWVDKRCCAIIYFHL